MGSHFAFLRSWRGEQHAASPCRFVVAAARAYQSKSVRPQWTLLLHEAGSKIMIYLKLHVDYSRNRQKLALLHLTRNKCDKLRLTSGLAKKGTYSHLIPATPWRHPKVATRSTTIPESTLILIVLMQDSFFLSTTSALIKHFTFGTRSPLAWSPTNRTLLKVHPRLLKVFKVRIPQFRDLISFPRPDARSTDLERRRLTVAMGTTAAAMATAAAVAMAGSEDSQERWR